MLYKLHIWAPESRWPSGLSHALCSKNIVDIDFAAHLSDGPAETKRLSHTFPTSGICQRCRRAAAQLSESWR